MDCAEFLSFILPSTGLYVIAFPQTKTRPDGAEYLAWKHQIFETAQEAAAYALAADQQGLTVYHGCATLKNRFIEVDGKKKIRIAANILAARSLWADFDCGPGKPYETQKHALEAILKLTKVYGLPKPTVISSGRGVHAYWVMDRDIPIHVWKVLADRFKGVLHKLKIYADPARTADPCSILRPVGTHNRKDPQNPLPVRHITRKHVTTYEAVHNWIAEMEGQLQIQPPPSLKKSLFSDGTSFNKLSTKVDLSEKIDIPQEIDPDKIIASCDQMRAFCESFGKGEEPYWRGVLSVFRLCPDGRTLSHKFSAGHPTYSEAETDAKLKELTDKDIGPYRCTKFEEVNPGGCEKCKYQGTVNSPITLGTVYKVAESPIVIHGLSELKLPDPPKPYKRVLIDNEGHCKIVREMPESSNLSAVDVYDYDLYPIARMYDSVNKVESALMKVCLPKDGEREFLIPFKYIYDRKMITGILADAGVLVLPSRMEALLNYVVSYIQVFQKTLDATNVIPRMGWQHQDTQFVLGHTAYTQSGQAFPISKTIMDRNIAASTLLGTKGSLTEWTKVVNTYNRAGQEPFLFAFLAGGGSPLLKLLGFDGMLVSIIDDGGTGKTTVQQAILSIYGNPLCKDVLITPQDTSKSVIAKLSALTNLPAVLDDFSGTDESDLKALADLAYAISQGKGRDRLHSDGSISERRERWELIGIISSNRSTYTRLNNYRNGANAESMRIFEYSGPDREEIDVTPSEARHLFKTILPENYGHAGPIFISYLAAHREDVRKRLIDRMSTIERLVGDMSKERFWLAGMTVARVFGDLLNELGLAQFDMERLDRWMIRQMHKAREQVDSYVPDPQDQLAELVHSMVTHTLIMKEEKIVFREPNQKLLARYEMANNRMYIASTEIHRWCKSKQVDPGIFGHNLELSGAILTRRKSIRLGSHSNTPTAPTNCWVFDMVRVEELSGTGGRYLVNNSILLKKVDTNKNDDTIPF